MGVSGQTSPARVLCAASELGLRPDGVVRDLALCDIAADPGLGRAERVSRLIEAGFEGGTGTRAVAMSIQDRQIALFRLAFSLGTWPAWFNSRCGTCGEGIDLRVATDEFTIAPPPGPVPAEIEIEGPGGMARFRVPTGVEEAALAADPGAGLLELCAPADLPPGDRMAWEGAFDAALAAVLPVFTPELSFTCPECGEPARWWFDPVDWIARHSGQSLREVDLLARYYGWSEDAILALPEARRRRYISLIESGR